MITLRQTILGTYEMCPFMCGELWGEYGSEPAVSDNDEENQNKYSYTGIKFHDTMEYWGNEKIRKNRSNYCLSNLHKHLDAGLMLIPSKFFDNTIDELDFRGSLHDQLDWVYDQACQNTPLEVEHEIEPIELIPGLPPFTGKIDRIDGSMVQRDIEMIDYKTGKPYTKNELKSNIQATIYSLYWRVKHGFYPKEFTFYFSKYKKSKTIEITPEFIDNGVERIKNIWMHVLNKDFNPPIKPNKFYCKHFCKSKKCRHKTSKWSNVGFEVFNPNMNLMKR
jgi:hypothetical protein